AFEKLAPGQDPSLRTYISEFIRRIVQFVADAYDWVLGRDIITSVFNNLAQELHVDMSSYTLDRTDTIDPTTGEYVQATDAELRAKRASGDATNVTSREAAAGYFAVLYQGKNQRKRFESGMRREFDQTWLDLPVAVRNATFEAAV